MIPSPKAKIASDDPRYVFMPESEILNASGLTNIIRDHWWSVHPEKGLRFWQSVRGRQGQLIGASPQCNANREIVERVLRHECDEIKQIPLVIVPIKISDYAQ